MKTSVRLSVQLLAILALWIAFPAFAQAAVIDDMNWADEVYEWEGNIMNYGLHSTSELMTEDTTWWLTGEPDADANGNGYAFDSVDHDYVGGWRNCGSSSNPENFTVKFNMPLKDGEEDDLVLISYGGTGSDASIYASCDGENFVFIDCLGNGTSGILEETWLDFDGLIDNVQYIKVVRATTGPNTGCFFDAIGGEVVLIPGDANLDGFVDGSDATILATYWQYGSNEGEETNWGMGDFNDDGIVDGSDATILASHWQEGTPPEQTTATVPEPQTSVLLALLIGSFLYWRKR